MEPKSVPNPEKAGKKGMPKIILKFDAGKSRRRTCIQSTLARPRVDFGVVWAVGGGRFYRFSADSILIEVAYGKVPLRAGWVRRRGKGVGSLDEGFCEFSAGVPRDGVVSQYSITASWYSRTAILESKIRLLGIL